MSTTCVNFTIRQNVNFSGVFDLMQEDEVTPFDLTGYSLSMRIRHGSSYESLTTANGRISIVDAPNGKIEFSALDTWLLTLESATYQHQLIGEATGVKPEFWHGTMAIVPGVMA